MTHVCEPVFVVGMNGSGTSMMLDSLGRHPQLYALPDETHLMPYIIGQADRFGDLYNDENFTAYGRFAIDEMPVLQRITGGEKLELPENWLSLPRTPAGVFHGIFGSLAERQNKQRWCEKTPDHVQHIEMLAEIFPRAKFIHMIRDGREVACSLHRRQKKRPVLVIYRWKKLVRAGRLAGETLDGRYLELRYEDLTRNVREHMQKVCRFLGLEFAEEVLQSRMPQSPQRKSLAKGEVGEISSNPLKWPGYFDSETVRRLERISGRTLAELGYEVQTEADDRDPNRFQQKCWRAIDFMRFTLERKRSSKRYNTWPKIARHVMFAFKEYRSKRY